MLEHICVPTIPMRVTTGESAKEGRLGEMVGGRGWREGRDTHLVFVMGVSCVVNRNDQIKYAVMENIGGQKDRHKILLQ